jgi:cytochrome P450 family 110
MADSSDTQRCTSQARALQFGISHYCASAGPLARAPSNCRVAFVYGQPNCASSSSMLKLPPQGPRGRLRTTIAVTREPYAATRRWRAQFGSTYMTSVMSGRYLVTGDPAVVRDVFRADPKSLYPEGEEALKPLTGPRSLFLLESEEHAKERKVISPPFIGARMRAYTELMCNAAERQVAALKVGDTFPALEITRSISAEVIVRAVFGVQNEERVRLYREHIVRWVNAWKPLFILFPAMQRKFLGISPWARFVAAGEALDALLLQEIDARRAATVRNDDVLSLLLDTRYEDGSALSDDSIRCHLRALLFAGHETTMIAMAWVLHYVLRDAQLKDRMFALVVRPMDEIVQDPWFEAVINEALRLYPIILGVVRGLGASTQLGPYTVPAGTKVWVSIAMLHLDPQLYPEPEQFRPERFLETSFKPHEFAPFGGGHRRCLGAAFAMLETKVAVATLLKRRNLVHAGPIEPGTVRRNLSMAPAGGICLKVTAPHS